MALVDKVAGEKQIEVSLIINCQNRMVDCMSPSAFIFLDARHRDISRKVFLKMRKWPVGRKRGNE